MDGGRTARLGMVRLAIFSSPVLVFQAIELPWRTYLPAFFSGTLGLPLAAVGALLMAIRLFDMGLDPLVGWASDRFPTRFGLRRPWLVAGAPLVMLGAGGVFLAPLGIGIGRLVLACVVLHIGYALMLTPHGGWGLEMARDPHERTRISGAKIWFAAIATPLILLLPSVMERGFHAGRTEQVAAMGLLLILLTPLSVALVMRCIPEPAVDGVATKAGGNPLRQLAAMVRERELGMILGLYALVGLAEASSGACFLFLVEEALALKGWASTLILIQSLVALGAIPLWAMASRRLGKRRALMGVFLWQAVTMPAALFLPAGGLAPLILFLVLRNGCWGGDFMLLRAMVADVSGRDAERGLRRSGSYYALFNVTLKLAMALGVGAALWALSRAGFVPGQAADAGAAGAIRLVYALPSCLAGMAGFLILLPGAQPRSLRARPGARAGSAL